MNFLLPAPKHVAAQPGHHERALPAALAPGDLPRLLAPETFTIAAEDAAFADCPHPGRAECYHLIVTPDAIRATALTAEGLLRAEATLLQLLEPGPDGLRLPCCEVVDWPDLRYRCASDWLLNCEINRWGYDWGDGPEAFLARIERKLDLCFRHKINQVWFDGFGWDVARTPHYAELVRACTRLARARGIRLTFAGYGGGYGTSYQKSELYRCGYQGEVFLNRRPWPDGEVYLCRGLESSEGRQYGSCLCNEGLAAAKLAEMRRFVEAVEPGFMYIHDIDSGTWAASAQSWRMRCDECRRRWPSDELTDPHGMAGALAEWFGRIARTLQEVRTDGYEAARDLCLVFTSSLYGACSEDDATWQQEVACFRLMSELIGPVPGVMFGIREQFLNADGTPRVRQLGEALDAVGHGHGAHVIAFAGGDNYTSNDLCNLSSALAPLYVGAASVCLSNGGVHEEPVQVINAECLWNAAQTRTSVPLDDPAAVQGLYRQLQHGHYRPEVVLGEGMLLQYVCRSLWGPEAGEAMYRAYLCGGDTGRGPVSRVWWVITREVRRLKGDPVSPAAGWEELAETWRQRVAHTREALGWARQAAAVSDHEDIHWFVQSLEVGLRFAEVVRWLTEHRHTGADSALVAAREALADLRAHLATLPLRPTDLLGGDPGCWQETLDALAELARGEV
ncbi:MAG: glycoside hydrolase family 20 zincin-like fold domain-containing protein [Armatimonadetes bacterium]|nr:glycoside hydrolase family 20 zincin-like fold domain-containing protein [Armatimonadota bacterium]